MNAVESKVLISERGGDLSKDKPSAGKRSGPRVGLPPALCFPGSSMKATRRCLYSALVGLRGLPSSKIILQREKHYLHIPAAPGGVILFIYPGRAV